jgi:S1-C subfamily serine protease
VQLAPGTQVDLVVLRDGKRKTLRVKLGERPLDTPRAG